MATLRGRYNHSRSNPGTRRGIGGHHPPSFSFNYAIALSRIPGGHLRFPVANLLKNRWVQPRCSPNSVWVTPAGYLAHLHSAHVLPVFTSTFSGTVKPTGTASIAAFTTYGLHVDDSTFTHLLAFAMLPRSFFLSRHSLPWKSFVVTLVLACVVATIALATDPGVKGPPLAATSAPAAKQPNANSPARQKEEEVDAFFAARYARLPVCGPIQPGATEEKYNPPSELEVLRALEKARPAEAGTQRNKIRIVVEPIQDCIDPPRVMRAIGPVQIHHVHFKCIVYFTEVTQLRGPTPRTIVDEDCAEVIYIDHDHLHRVAKPTPAK